jgi:hypothetical protein
MLDNGIKEIFQLGDLFDNRTNLSLKAFHICKSEWFEPLVEFGFTMHTLLGNHDITMRESLKINTPTSMLSEYVNSGHLKIYSKPEMVKRGKATIDIIPWICKENEEEVVKFTNRKKIGDLCIGHFEIKGFNMYRGIPGHGGLHPDVFARYESTLSGHYHTRSISNNIQYIGTPYEITWMDAHDPRGFTVFDTETRQFEFIQNPHTMFQKLYYKNGCTTDISGVAGKLVKLIVEKKDDLFEFDKFLTNLKSRDLYDLAILENLEDFKNGVVDDSLEIEDTAQIISNYIDSLQTSVDKSKVKAYINSLYVEAINL